MAKAEAVKEVLFSGKTSFKIEVPYELVETGDKGGDKPLIIYLHGYGDYLKSFKKKNSFLLNLDAYHLFIQGPYPVFDPSSKKPLPKCG